MLNFTKSHTAMKNISLLLISFLIYSLSTLAQWQSHQPFTTLDLNNACYSDGQNIFIVGEFGSIHSLTDTTLQSIYLPTTATLNSLCFIDDNIGYIVGDSGKIFRMDFSSMEWEDISIEDFFYLKDVAFIDYYNGIAVGTKQVRIDGRTYFLPSIHITTNAGLIWVEKHFDERGKFNSVSYFDEEIIIAVGDSGKALISYNNGIDWAPLDININTNLYDVKYCPDGVGIIVGDHGTIIISDDGWQSWYNVIVPEYWHFISVCAKDVYQYVAAGYMRVRIDGRDFNVTTIFSSDVGGVNWEPCFDSIRGAFNCVSFCNPNLAIAVGDSGLIALYESPTSLSVNNDKAVTNFILEQNYPNPFNPSTTISYQIPELSCVTLRVYDVLGNEVITLVNEEKPIGGYKVEFYTASLPSGVYFYQLQSGEFAETKKLILLK